ncbi:MAG: TldD/PmbA family protein [Candidatus Baldrarchaeia archaeon]
MLICEGGLFLEHEDLVEYAVEMGEKLGADYVEARLQKTLSNVFLLKNGVPEVSGIESSFGIGIRVLVDGGMSFTSLNRFSKELVKEKVEEALKMAKASSKTRKKPIVLSEEKTIMGSWRTIFKQNPLDTSPEEKLEALLDVDKSILETGKRLKAMVPGRLIQLSDTYTYKYYVNSEGTKVREEIVGVSGFAVITVVEPSSGGFEQQYMDVGATKGFEVLEEWNLPKKCAELTEILVKILREAKKPVAEEIDIVLGPQIVGIACHESVGHPYEADRILGREAAQAGESFVKKEMLGQKIGSEIVNVVDDPTIPYSYGYYRYDDEGVPARKRYLIKNGVINEFLHNRETAGEFGVQSNAAARAIGYNREPIVRMANTYLEPGDYSFEELIEDIKLGIYMKTFGEWNIDDRRFNQRYIGKEAYLIEKGEIKHLVKNPILEITTPAFWSSIDAIGKAELMEFEAAICGKGDPDQGAPVWHGGPPARLRKIRLGG